MASFKLLRRASHNARSLVAGFKSVVGNFLSYQAHTAFELITAIPQIPNAVDTAIDSFVERMVIKLTKPRQVAAPSAKPSRQPAGERLYDLLFNGALAVVPPEPSATVPPHGSWTNWLLGFGSTTSSSTESASAEPLTPAPPSLVCKDCCGFPKVPFLLAHQSPAIDYIPKIRNVYRHPMNACDMWTPFFQPDHSLTEWDDMYRPIPSGGGTKSVGPPLLHVRLGEAAISSIDHAYLDYFIVLTVVFLFIKPRWHRRRATRVTLVQLDVASESNPESETDAEFSGSDGETGSSDDGDDENGDDHKSGNYFRIQTTKNAHTASKAIVTTPSASSHGNARILADSDRQNFPSQAAVHTLPDAAPRPNTLSSNHLSKVQNQITSRARLPPPVPSARIDSSRKSASAAVQNQTTVRLPPTVPSARINSSRKSVSPTIVVEKSVSKTDETPAHIRADIHKMVTEQVQKSDVVAKKPDEMLGEWEMVFDSKTSIFSGHCWNDTRRNPFSLQGVNYIRWEGLPKDVTEVTKLLSLTPNLYRLSFRQIKGSSLTDFILREMNKRALVPRLQRLQLKDCDVTTEKLFKFCERRYHLMANQSAGDAEIDLKDKQLRLAVVGSQQLREDTVALLNEYLRIGPEAAYRLNKYARYFNRREREELFKETPSELVQGLHHLSDPVILAEAHALTSDSPVHLTSSKEQAGIVHELPSTNSTNNEPWRDALLMWLDRRSGVENMISNAEPPSHRSTTYDAPFAINTIQGNARTSHPQFDFGRVTVSPVGGCNRSDAPTFKTYSVIGEFTIVNEGNRKKVYENYIREKAKRDALRRRPLPKVTRPAPTPPSSATVTTQGNRQIGKDNKSKDGKKESVQTKQILKDDAPPMPVSISQAAAANMNDMLYVGKIDWDILSDRAVFD